MGSAAVTVTGAGWRGTEKEMLPPALVPLGVSLASL